MILLKKKFTVLPFLCAEIKLTIIACIVRRCPAALQPNDISVRYYLNIIQVLSRLNS